MSGPGDGSGNPAEINRIQSGAMSGAETSMGMSAEVTKELAKFKSEADFYKSMNTGGKTQFDTGDVLVRDKDGQKLSMLNGDQLKVDKDGSLDLKTKVGKDPVEIKVKGGQIIVKRPNGQQEHFPAADGLNLKDGVSIGQDATGHTTIAYRNGDKVTCDKEGVLSISRGNVVESFARRAQVKAIQEDFLHVPPLDLQPKR